MPPDLSIIIVNWNTADLLGGCLRSIYSTVLDAGWEVIVVDNASKDQSVPMVESAFPAVHMIRNSYNAGFARANNQGILISHGRYVLLLNSDTLVPAGALGSLMEFMDHHPEAGICAPRLLREDGTTQPFAFGDDPTPGYLLRRALAYLFLGRSLHDWSTDHPMRTDWVAGTCLMARRPAVDQAGLLDEHIFLYFEDNDWCLRIRRCGWKIYYCPEVSITHLGGRSVSRNPDARGAYYRSLEYFYTKHYGSMARLWLKLALPVYRKFVSY